VIQYGFEPERGQAIQCQRKDEAAVSCGVRTIAQHPVSQNFKPHRALVAIKWEGSSISWLL